MSESQSGIFILLGVALLTALFCHWRIHKYLLASLAAAVVSITLFQIIDFLRLGYLDPFFLIALFLGGTVAWGIALITGIPFFIKRRARRSRSINV